MAMMAVSTNSRYDMRCSRRLTTIVYRLSVRSKVETFYLVYPMCSGGLSRLHFQIWDMLNRAGNAQGSHDRNGKLPKRTRNINERYHVIMYCLKSAEFFREDQNIGARAGDQYRDEPNDRFLNIRVIFFDFSLYTLFVFLLLINISRERNCQMMW
jgi:hypothetical protein